MNITIQTINFKESKHLTKFVHEKVGKLFNQYPETIRVDITLKEGAKSNPTNQWCALYLSHRGENQFVKRNSTSYEESIILCVEAMEKILRRQKTKKVKQRNDKLK
ncbi:MAG: HPF/RaiA family ribosome-associated protein [Bacteroidia bacterium]